MKRFSVLQNALANTNGLLNTTPCITNPGKSNPSATRAKFSLKLEPKRYPCTTRRVLNFKPKDFIEKIANLRISFLFTTRLGTQLLPKCYPGFLGAWKKINLDPTRAIQKEKILTENILRIKIHPESTRGTFRVIQGVFLVDPKGIKMSFRGTVKTLLS